LNNHPELLQPGVSEKMLQAIMAKTETGETPAVVKRISWGRIAAAVCLLGLIALSYFIFSKKVHKIPVITTKAPRTDVAAANRQQGHDHTWQRYKDHSRQHQ
jgi:hypothetical protein